jgi:hypothetical protein
MSENTPQSAGSPPSVLDEAIDRAVRKMAQIDPRPGFRRRVESRLAATIVRRSAWSWGYPAAASAAAMLAVAVGFLWHSNAPADGVRLESRKAPADVVLPLPSTRVAESRALAAPIPKAPERVRRREPAAQPLAARSSAPDIETITMPRISNVFGAGGNTLAAASLTARDDVGPAARGGNVTASRIAISDLSIAPLQIEPPLVAPGKPQAAPPAVDVKRRNVSIEVSLTDQNGSAEPVKKVVTMVVADRQMANVRSSGSVVDNVSAAGAAPGVITQHRPLTLNIDAHPVVHGDDSILLSLTLEYVPSPMDGEKAGTRAQLNERMAVTLESGKPMVVSRAADPGSTRKMVVEVTATVMK